MENKDYQKAIQTAKLVIPYDGKIKMILKGKLTDEISEMIRVIKEQEIEGLEVDVYNDGLQMIRRMSASEYHQFMNEILSELRLTQEYFQGKFFEMEVEEGEEN